LANFRDRPSGDIGGVRSPWKRTFHVVRREDVTVVTF
jgi:hypothetical protein